MASAVAHGNGGFGMSVGTPAHSISGSQSKKGRTKMELVFNIAVFTIFLVLWVAFAYALVANQGGLDNIWKTIQGLPLIAQAVVWVLFLPVTIGLWIWESAWPLLVRLPLVAALAGWNIWMFFPFKG
jgi:hypothetical protein